MNIHTGEIYGKQTANKFVMYNVVKIINDKNTKQLLVTLQNIDNPLNFFEATTQKLASTGYIRISQTPFIDLATTTPKRSKAARKPNRCPLTFDFLEARADSERPATILPDLFS